jgi:hypothetical protein
MIMREAVVDFSKVEIFSQMEMSMSTKCFQTGLLSFVVLSIVAFVVGCSQEAPAKKEPAKPAATTPAKPEATKTSAATEKKADALPGLAELSPADRTLAEKQKICPVSDELLGEHGKPIKITVKGEVVFLCCAACEDPIKKDPDKFLAKLKLTPKAAK